MIRKIKKIGFARFRITTHGVAHSQLFLDFNPLIKKFNLKGNFSLIHWQAKPKNYREWGIYNSETDSYSSIPGFEMKGIFTSLQIPDQEAIAIPSAVLHIQHH